VSVGASYIHTSACRLIHLYTCTHNDKYINTLVYIYKYVKLLSMIIEEISGVRRCVTCSSLYVYTYQYIYVLYQYMIDYYDSHYCLTPIAVIPVL
jgi:hypothetical protein